MQRFSKWWSMPAWERKVFLRLLLLLPMVSIGLRVAGFSRMRRWAEAMPAAREPDHFSRPTQPELVQAAQRYAALTNIAARHGLYKANCLHQALALCYLLRRQRVPAGLRLGVRKDLALLDGHAWVELDGHVLGEPVSGYAAFDRLETTQKMTG